MAAYVAAAAADSGAVDSHRAGAAAAAAEAEEDSESSVGDWLQLEAEQKSADLYIFPLPRVRLSMLYIKNR